MNKKMKSSIAGFSLVELLLYMGLFVGFLTILSALFITTLEAQSDAVVSANVDQDSWYIFSRLQHDSYQATSVITPANNGDSATELILDLNGSTVTYSLVDNKLVITQDSQTAPIVSSRINVENLNFTKLGNEETASIKVRMDLIDSVIGQQKNINFTIGVR